MHPDLRKIVVVTMANWGFREFLFNWQCMAERIGLDYVVLSMDGILHKHLGPTRSVQMDDKAVHQAWGTTAYYDLGCHKLSAIALLVSRGWSVLFSDPDNVFGRVPKQLLAEATSQEYDALVQADHPECSSRKRCPEAPTPASKRGRTANGGFYFFSGAPSSRRGVAAILTRAAALCRRHPRNNLCCDDQQGLNRAIVEVAAGELRNNTGYVGTTFCGVRQRLAGAAVSAAPGQLFRYCIMDPKQHPAGSHAITSSMVSHHANWIMQISNKKRRLQKLRLWGLRSDGRSCAFPPLQ
eukprot:TRINITY_DN35883_c0_g1_i1.p1 TRINITY_DN35883_c0_g1~~TRINITY_DN35883_c0_g1_i1.p1  ORF type:complete len:296 (+),score=61.60 TRINITY_DN35883_c0_g1_i1:249-1136(+)